MMRRFTLTLTVALGLLLTASPAPARAEEQPSILKAYGLDWIERVREEAWPEPKERRPVICLLDTGVAVTPDTPADDPSGPIVARLAVDGDDGLPQGTSFQHLHGTQMASVIAAPRNNYGTVGVFPQARIVSVRVTQGAEVFITPADMELGAQACELWAFAHARLRVAALVMAESQYDQRTVDIRGWERVAAKSAAAGAVFVAAVGNAENAKVVAPVAADGVLSVSAGDDAGSACAFSVVPLGLGLVGPGCSTQLVAGRPVWPTGSSAATAATGALVAALATREPSRAAPELARLIIDAATPGGQADRRIDGSGFSRGTFAGFLTDPPLPPPGHTEITVGPAAGTGPAMFAARVALWRPFVKGRCRPGRLVVTRRDHRGRGHLRVVLNGHSQAESWRPGRRVAVPVVKCPRRIRVWVESSDGRSWRSLSTRVRVTR